jgi:hypothetical protein
MAREVVSGVGKGAKRTDLGNVAKIQRSAKVQNATGGTYGQRAELRSIAQGAPMPTTASAMSSGMPEQTMPRAQATDAFEKGTGNLTDGAGFNTAGTPPNSMTPAFTSPNPGRILAAALYTVNPNPYNRMILESYDEEGIY